MEIIVEKINVSHMAEGFLGTDFCSLVLGFSLIWRHHHCQRRAANIDLCWALMAIEQ